MGEVDQLQDPVDQGEPTAPRAYIEPIDSPFSPR